MILNGKVKRACIYVIYDRDGVIDDYIIYQLQDMRKNVEFLHCVINGRLTSDGRKALEKIADEIYVRENTGMDIGAYKDALEYIGWEDIQNFDELVLMNDTCFGPVYPFKEVFDWAEKQDVDFWGLTMGICEMRSFPEEYSGYSFAREHVQSYFVVIRKPLLESRDFKDFIDSRPEFKSYFECGFYFENTFTNYFRIRGWEFKTYCDCSELLKYHNYPMMIFPAKLLKEQRCPLIKKKVFSEAYTELISQCVGQPSQEVFDFLDESGLYDVNLIWSNLLRTQDLSVLVRDCHLVRILPRDYKASLDYRPISVGVVCHAFYTDLFEETIRLLCGFPKGTEFLITTNTEEKKRTFFDLFSPHGYKFEIRVIENRGRDISALLVGARDFVKNFDLICFSHDKKTTQQSPGSVGISWAYELNQNMIATNNYISNVISTFALEPKLGIAFPPYPVHNDYNNLATGWTWCYEQTIKLLEKFKINVPTDVQKLCVAPLGTNFWFRPKALEKLFEFNWEYECFPKEPNNTDGTILHAIERAFAYFAQYAGYYPAFIMNDVYARIEHINLDLLRVGAQQMYGYLHNEFMGNVYGNTNNKSTQQYTTSVNYGIKASLKQLAMAIRCKYPRFWKLMLPFRRLGQKILGIKTK